MAKQFNFYLTLVLFGVLLAISPSARADDKLDCRDTSNMNQNQMNMCAAQDFDEADAALNKIWPKVKDYAKAGDDGLGEGEMTGAGMLLKAQKAWLVFRDSECELEGFAARGGSLQPMLVAGCKAALTNERVKALRALLSSEAQ